MKIVVCWFDISGYMTACWRALAAIPGVELFVLAFAAPRQNAATVFDTSLLGNVSHRFLDEAERLDTTLIQKLVLEQKPDAVIVAGWMSKPYLTLPAMPELATAHFAMAMDTPWRGTLRQHLARFKLKSFLSRISTIFVTGERSWQFARRLGVEESKIFRGVYGVNFESLSSAMPLRMRGPWPRRFLFVGRYAEEKNVGQLLEAYAAYRSSSSDPWSLTCAGRGPMDDAIRSAPGVTDAGFVQPTRQPELFAEHGAFVLPSLYDPWPLAIVEACASGLPVICSEACGSGVELIRSRYNGMKFATGSVSAMADAMRWIESQHETLAIMGERSQVFAGAHDARLWAQATLAALSR